MRVLKLHGYVDLVHQVTTLPKLESLTLSGNRSITEDYHSLSFLKKFPGLKHLSVTGVNFRCREALHYLDIFSQLPFLQSLEINDSSIDISLSSYIINYTHLCSIAPKALWDRQTPFRLEAYESRLESISFNNCTLHNGNKYVYFSSNFKQAKE